MTEDIVAIVESADGYLLRNFVGRSLENTGKKVEYFKYATSAIPSFETKRYDFILINLDLAPGDDLNLYPDLEKIFQKTNPLLGIPDYDEVGYYVVRKARQSKQNSKTTIITARISNPDLDEIRLNAKKRSIEAGANKYVSFLEDDWSNKIIKDIESVLGKKSV